MRRLAPQALITFLVLLISGVSSTAYAHSRSYGGTPRMMKGLTKVFVDTAGDAELRDIMNRVISKRLPNVKILDDSEEAELVLEFRYSEAHGEKVSHTGRLHVSKQIGSKLLSLDFYKHHEDELDDLADEIIKIFVKQYKKVNDIK